MRPGTRAPVEEDSRGETSPIRPGDRVRDRVRMRQRQSDGAVGGRARAAARCEADAAAHRRGQRTAIAASHAPRWRPPPPARMIVHVDASALVDALTGPRRSLDVLFELTNEGHRLMLSAIALYEWLRGPRTRPELAAQEELFPAEAAVAFGAGEAATAARLYKQARGRAGARSIWPSRPARLRTTPRSGR
jgi:predicted nucleic acid-binding protein